MIGFGFCLAVVEAGGCWGCPTECIFFVRDREIRFMIQDLYWLERGRESRSNKDLACHARIIHVSPPPEALQICALHQINE